MIVSFLFLIDYLLKVVQSRILKRTISNNSLCIPDAIQVLNCLKFEGIAINDDDVGIRFMPPAYYQRYSAVYNVLVQLQSIYDIKKVVDIGCAEIAFFSYIKRLEAIEEYIAVDIDEFILEKNSCRVIPLHSDYLSRRCSPLKVSILKGSATEPDVRLKYANAVVAIELIEHLYPTELDDLPYNIFGVIQPDVAIFTTPNSDFNILFKSLQPNTFRHYDHKFEWNRQQFEDWGQNLALRYPGYEVWFNGIGRGPDGTEEFGCCSQIAVFVRKEVKTESSDFNVYYKTVHEVEYPYQTYEEKLNDILEYEVYQFIDHCSRNEGYIIGEQIEIPLVDILNYITIPCTEERLKTFLEKSGKHVECINNKLKLVLPAFSDDNRSLSSFDGIIQDVFNNEESWIIEKNNIFNDIVANDESWSYVLENVNEMKPELNSDSDQIEDDVGDLADQLECFLRNGIEDVAQSTESNYAKDAVYDQKQSKVHYSLLSDDEDARADSFTPPGENQAQYLNMDNILQHSGSTGSGNTSKSSDTLVEHSLSPINKIKNCMSDKSCENNDSSSIEDFRSDEVPVPSSSSCDNGVESPKNIPDSSHHNGEKLSCDVIKNECQKEIHENKTKQNIDIPIPNTETAVGEHNDVADSVVEENINAKQDQSSSLVSRSHSLETVNMYKCKDKCFRYSLNIDNKLLDCDTSVVDMDIEKFKGSSIPSLTETNGSHSKAVDSGYPNSTQDMDLDLTPEQVDEIITETESSLEDEESSADERVEPLPVNPPLVFADNVENGDVANNNRDGEGNNMEGGDMLPEELIFEDLVIGGEEMEAAGEHESDDDGLFLSALDVSNDTVVPEEMSSNEDTIYLFDLPSPSSFGSLRVEEAINIENQNQFPSWLLSMEVGDDYNGSGDAGPDRDEDSSDLVVDREGQVDMYPGDARAGGEPTQSED